MTLTFRFFKIIGGFVQLAMIITTLILPSIFMAVSITFIPNSIMTFHQLAWYEYQCFFNDLMNIFWYDSLMKRKIFNDSRESRIKLNCDEFNPHNWQFRSNVNKYESYESGVNRLGIVSIYIRYDCIGILPTFMIWKID